MKAHSTSKSFKQEQLQTKTDPVITRKTTPPTITPPRNRQDDIASLTMPLPTRNAYMNRVYVSRDGARGDEGDLISMFLECGSMDDGYRYCTGSLCPFDLWVWPYSTCITVGNKGIPFV